MKRQFSQVTFEALLDPDRCLKRGFATRQHAEEIVDEMIRCGIAHDPKRLHAYPCGKCFFWHVGHSYQHNGGFRNE
jgi:hypothetical protein